MSEPLTKVDSAVQGLSSSPPKDAAKGHRRASSSAAGVYNVNDLGMSPLLSPLLTGWSGSMLTRVAESQGIELKIAPETQRLGW